VTTGGDHPAAATLARDVVVVRWPEEAPEAKRLGELAQPRLLLVAPDADPPEGGACEEDWVRLPADDRDIAARLHALRRRVDRHQVAPTLDGRGRLIHRGKWVALSPIEERLVTSLVERFGTVVAAADMARMAWPDEKATANAFRVQLLRLRQRIAPLGLEIRGVRGRGLVLEER